MAQEGEQPYPEGGENFTIGEELETVAPPPDCRGSWQIQDRGNTQYAWWYLINASDQMMITTIRRSWIYEGQHRSDTQNHTLYPRQELEVFSFDRIQRPQVTPLSCSLT